MSVCWILPDDMETEEWGQVKDTWEHFVYRVRESLIAALARYHDLPPNPYDDSLIYQAIEEVIAPLSREGKLAILVGAVGPVIEGQWQDILCDFQVRQHDLDECGMSF